MVQLILYLVSVFIVTHSYAEPAPEKMYTHPKSKCMVKSTRIRKPSSKIKKRKNKHKHKKIALKSFKNRMAHSIVPKSSSEGGFYRARIKNNNKSLSSGIFAFFDKNRNIKQIAIENYTCGEKNFDKDVLISDTISLIKEQTNNIFLKPGLKLHKANFQRLNKKSSMNLNRYYLNTKTLRLGQGSYKCDSRGNGFGYRFDLFL